MPTPDQDFAYFQAGAAELKDYLLSDELYWQLSVRDVSIPRLSLGLLLLARKRLEAQARSFPGLESLDTQVEAVRTKWRSVWERKATREIYNRINLWRNYLADCRDGSSANVEAYSHEVRMRIILELLLAEIPDLSVPESLIMLDDTLRKCWLPGEFLWEREIAFSFPEKQYWFLYGRLNL
jgi:hypothetical protein